jgi:hypothetical protein
MAKKYPKLVLNQLKVIESFTFIYTPWDLTQGGLHGNFVPMCGSWLMIELKVN